MVAWAVLRGSESVFELDAPTVTIGRGDDCDIILADSKSVSATHAKIVFQKGHRKQSVKKMSPAHYSHASKVEREAEDEAAEQSIMIYDLGSRNGTFVNDLRLQNNASHLYDGDTVRFGYDKHSFRFELIPPASDVASQKSTPVASNLSPAAGKSKKASIHRHLTASSGDTLDMSSVDPASLLEPPKRERPSLRQIIKDQIKSDPPTDAADTLAYWSARGRTTERLLQAEVEKAKLETELRLMKERQSSESLPHDFLRPASAQSPSHKSRKGGNSQKHQSKLFHEMVQELEPEAEPEDLDNNADGDADADGGDAEGDVEGQGEEEEEGAAPAVATRDFHFRPSAFGQNKTNNNQQKLDMADTQSNRGDVSDFPVHEMEMSQPLLLQAPNPQVSEAVSDLRELRRELSHVITAAARKAGLDAPRVDDEPSDDSPLDEQLSSTVRSLKIAMENLKACSEQTFEVTRNDFQGQVSADTVETLDAVSGVVSEMSSDLAVQQMNLRNLGTVGDRSAPDGSEATSSKGPKIIRIDGFDATGTNTSKKAVPVPNEYNDAQVHKSELVQLRAQVLELSQTLEAERQRFFAKDKQKLDIFGEQARQIVTLKRNIAEMQRQQSSMQSTWTDFASRIDALQKENASLVYALENVSKSYEEQLRHREVLLQDSCTEVAQWLHSRTAPEDQAKQWAVDYLARQLHQKQTETETWRARFADVQNDNSRLKATTEKLSSLIRQMQSAPGEHSDLIQLRNEVEFLRRIGAHERVSECESMLRASEISCAQAENAHRQLLSFTSAAFKRTSVYVKQLQDALRKAEANSREFPGALHANLDVTVSPSSASSSVRNTPRFQTDGDAFSTTAAQSRRAPVDGIDFKVDYSSWSAMNSSLQH